MKARIIMDTLTTGEIYLDGVRQEMVSSFEVRFDAGKPTELTLTHFCSSLEFEGDVRIAENIDVYGLKTPGNHGYGVDLRAEQERGMAIRLAMIAQRREEIIEAFIAKYGCEPEEIEQVDERTDFGSRWYLRKREGGK